MKSVLIMITLSFCAYSVELKQATNQQLLSELSSRLGSGSNNGISILNGFCNRENLNLELETATSSIKKSIDLTFSSTCTNSLMKLKFGRFQGLKIAAICDRDEMYKIKASSAGTLTIDLIDHRTSSDCERSAAQINRQ